MVYTPLSQWNSTPLLIAIERGRHDIVRLLLDNGADPKRPDIVSVKGNKCGFTVLEITDMVCIALHGFYVHVLPCMGFSVIRPCVTYMTCIYIFNTEYWYIRTLLSLQEFTPLLIAIERDHYDIVKLLLDNGADPNRFYRVSVK